MTPSVTSRWVSTLTLSIDNRVHIFRSRFTDELKATAVELQDLVQRKVGTTKFAVIYNKIRQTVLGVQRERRVARVTKACLCFSSSSAGGKILDGYPTVCHQPRGGGEAQATAFCREEGKSETERHHVCVSILPLNLLVL